MTPPLISLVVPVFNEEKNIEPLLDRILPILKPLNYEVVFIDDGSQDKTVEVITQFAKKNPCIRLAGFTRNFSHQIALTCGYSLAKGDCIITIDADLQDAPEIIPEMIEKWKKGAKIVYAKRSERQVDSFFKRNTALIFYRFINLMSDTPIPEDVGDFRLLDREVVEFLNKLPEHSRFLRGLVAWGGYPAEYVYFKRAKRNAGQTHYTLSKMINFALEGLTSFSTKPLRMTIYLGFLVSLFSIIVVFEKVVQHYLFHSSDWVPGWPSLFFAVVFLGGIQLVTIGIIGEYIGKIYKETQQRPFYLIKTKVNI
ncbi:glycosyltransferase family 2 protein [Candidatus Roizmanbacteria bacterium]|nr:glycosyltransferase family 2 protein [Candidatus Roizmanbacteria bacterium]